jgi:hypothetical protein
MSSTYSDNDRDETLGELMEREPDPTMTKNPGVPILFQKNWNR